MGLSGGQNCSAGADLDRGRYPVLPIVGSTLGGAHSGEHGRGAGTVPPISRRQAKVEKVEKAENKVLDVRHMKTYFYLDEGVLKAVDGVSFSVGARQTLGVIGESGCGKSVMAQSIIRIVPRPGRTVGGQVLLRRDGEVVDMAQMDPYGPQVRGIRGKVISMIFQEPMTSLSPVHSIGDQIMEVILLHETRDKARATELTLQMLVDVGIPNPPQRIEEYPHQLSGGLRQRAMIAMALSCNPSLLIADEPTTALDVTVQAQILDLMKRLQERYGMSILYITHDLGVIAEIADEVCVMYLGKVVEQAGTREIFKRPVHPYTVRLLRSLPTKQAKGRRLESIEGTVPIPLDFPEICGFFSRCPEAREGLCNGSTPELEEVAAAHQVRCFFARRFAAGEGAG